MSETNTYSGPETPEQALEFIRVCQDLAKRAFIGATLPAISDNEAKQPVNLIETQVDEISSGKNFPSKRAQNKDSNIRRYALVTFWEGADLPEVDVDTDTQIKWTAKAHLKLRYRPMTSTDWAKILFAEKIQDTSSTTLQGKANAYATTNKGVKKILADSGVRISTNHIPGYVGKWIMAVDADDDKPVFDLSRQPEDEELWQLAYALRKEYIEKTGGQIVKVVRPAQLEINHNAQMFRVTIPESNNLKEPEKSQDKISDQAELTLRGKIRIVTRLLESQGIDLTEPFVKIPVKSGLSGKDKAPLKAALGELVRQGYATSEEVLSAQMDIYALIALILMRSNAANIITGLNDGKRVLNTQKDAQNIIVDAVNQWLIDGREQET